MIRLGSHLNATARTSLWSLPYVNETDMLGYTVRLFTVLSLPGNLTVTTRLREGTATGHLSRFSLSICLSLSQKKKKCL